jgi:DNA repair exonuclease SbcCD nuclease subunit
MSKVIFVADFHFGIHNKTNDILMAAKSVRNYAADNEIKHVFILGDLFHDRESMNLEVASVVYKFLKSCKDEFNQKWHVFPGNHDMYYKYNWKVTSLIPFSDVCTVIDDVYAVNVYDQNFYVVPFMAVDKAYMDVIDELDDCTKHSDIILTHIGCIGASYNLCFLFQEQKAINFDHRNAGKVYTGHFHCHHQAGLKTTYTGSPIPFSFDEGVVEHGFIEYDCQTRNEKFVDLRPLMAKYFVNETLPPNMYTIAIDDIKKIDDKDIEGNCFRIVSEQYLPDELMLEYRKDLVEKGARMIRFLKLSDMIAPQLVNGNNRIVRSDMNDLFMTYYESDPNGNKYNKDLLKSLNMEIVHDGDSMYTVDNMIGD